MMKKLLLIFTGLLQASILLAGEPVSDELDEVFASRGNAQVMHRAFDARMERIPEKDRAPILRDHSRLEKILAEMLLQQQVAADARVAGFDRKPMVQSRMELAATTELAEAWLAHYVASQPEADLEALAHDYYLTNPEQFVSEATIDVSHILISTDKRALQEAATLAREIHLQLAVDPARFEELLAAHSDDPAAAPTQGRFTGVKRGDMVQAFEDTAFSLDTGVISQPVLTQYGYHIIRLDAIHEAGPIAFEVVRESLMDKAQVRHKKRIRIDYINQLAAVETSLTPESIRKMLLRYVDEDQLKRPGSSDSE